MNNVFLTDVLNQPAAMRAAMKEYESYGPELEKIAALNPRRILFTGMGSSHYCSQPAVIRLIEAGFEARVEAASEILYYEYRDITPDTLLILTSQSGGSGEIVDIINRLPAEQTVIGITNDPESALGRRANIRLEMHVAEELAVSTRTYLSSLILTDLVVSALLGQPIREALDNWKKAVDALEHFLDGQESTQSAMAAFMGHPETVCYIGRGPALATAECGALFTRETAKYPALAFDSGEFRHGPFEMVDGDFRAVVFVPEGKTLELQKHLTQAITACGGKVVFVTDADVGFDSDKVLILKHDCVGERFAVLVEIAAAQFFANEMALFRGHAPGVFRQSSKITTAQ